MAQITAGVKLQYASDNSPTGWNPTSPTAAIADITGEWSDIPDITEIPEFGASPDTLETTSLDNTVYKTYIAGLLDTGGTISIKANDTLALRAELDDLDTALAAGKVWFRINVPAPIDQSIIFSGDVTPLGFGGAGVNSVLQTTINLIPSTEPVWLDN